MKNFIFLFNKRLIDILVSSILIIFITPIMIFFCILIRIETRGSPIFIQDRIGKNGITFKIIKLRGMYIDAKKKYPELYDFTKKNDLDFYYHQANDPRVTKIGSFIRQKSIDELPNVFNVLFGSMSLVGPRPEIPEVINLYGEYKKKIISVKPGITCISKISGRDELTKKETIIKDIKYIDNMSLILDLKILFKTFFRVILSKDVF